MDIKRIKEQFNNLTLESDDHWDYRGNSKSERDYVHGFCTYPAMMVPKMQREILDVFISQIDNEKPVLLDPFAGSGTILVEGMLKGLDVVGIDINPLAILLCKVKTTIVLPDSLNDATIKLKANIDNIQEQGHKNYEFKGIKKWFTERAISELSILREAILLENHIELRRFFWATFCEVVRIVSNSRDCTYKLHIKEKEDIENYDKNAIEIFKTTLDFNVNKYNLFYSKLLKNGYIKRGGVGYRGNVKIALADSIQYLNHTHQKFDLILTSPPYGDNHTTVSYGQYSVMPLRWINCSDIDSNFDEEIIKTLNGIDSASLGGKSSDRTMSIARKKVLEKSEVLRTNEETIKELAENQVNKLVAFYSDYDKFLSAVSKKMKPRAVSVWTLGNRKIAKKEIPMDKIMEELCIHYNLRLVTCFSRKILNKRMPEINAYTGEEKASQTTMTREHILVFEKEEDIDA